MPAPNFFTDGSPYLAHPLLTTERTQREVQFLSGELKLAPKSRILDVGCGFGRHSVELARRGFTVTGIDSSATMLAAARLLARNEGVSVQLLQADGKYFRSETCFDYIICLFTTLGQVDHKGDNAKMLVNFGKLLCPGGRLAVEVPQQEPFVDAMRTHERFGDAQNYTEVSRHYDREQRIVTERFQIGTPRGVSEFLLKYRLYSKAALANLLAQTGFQPISWFAGYTNQPLEPESPTMLVISRNER